MKKTSWENKIIDSSNKCKVPNRILAVGIINTTIKYSMTRELK